MCSLFTFRYVFMGTILARLVWQNSDWTYERRDEEKMVKAPLIIQRLTLYSFYWWHILGWTRQAVLNVLQLAMRQTKLWDTLYGQFLNDDKSKRKTLATTTKLRADLKHFFPAVNIVEVANVLVARLSTTKNHVALPSDSQSQSRTLCYAFGNKALLKGALLKGPVPSLSSCCIRV